MTAAGQTRTLLRSQPVIPTHCPSAPICTLPSARSITTVDRVLKCQVPAIAIACSTSAWTTSSDRDSIVIDARRNCTAGAISLRRHLEESMRLIDPIIQFHHELQQIRRDIHAHPELCYEERRTS